MPTDISFLVTHIMLRINDCTALGFASPIIVATRRHGISANFKFGE